MSDNRPPIGFRLDYLPMSYEVSPIPQPQPPPLYSAPYDDDSSSSEENFQKVQGTKNYVTNFEYGCSWQFVNVNGPYPDSMVRGGVDSDGTVIFIGRAFHEGDMIPAKVMPDKQACYISHGGVEHPKEDFEVLRAGNFVWEFATSGSIPEGGVQCGQTVDGEPLYVGRALYQGTQTPGKIQSSHGCLYIPFGGEEVAITEYEVLCLR